MSRSNLLVLGVVLVVEGVDCLVNGAYNIAHSEICLQIVVILKAENLFVLDWISSYSLQKKGS